MAQQFEAKLPTASFNLNVFSAVLAKLVPNLSLLHDCIGKENDLLGNNVNAKHAKATPPPKKTAYFISKKTALTVPCLQPSFSMSLWEFSSNCARLEFAQEQSGVNDFMVKLMQVHNHLWYQSSFDLYHQTLIIVLCSRTWRLSSGNVALKTKGIQSKTKYAANISKET